MNRHEISDKLFERLQSRADQAGCSVDDLLSDLLDNAPAPSAKPVPYHLMLEHTTDTISLFDPDLRYLYVNPILTKLTGLDASEMIGRTDRELGMPEENLQFWRAAWDEVIETRSEKVITFDFPTPFGNQTFESRLTPIYDENDQLMYLLPITRDITERIHTEKMLQDITNQLPGMIMSYHLMPDGQDRLLFVSEGVQTIFEVAVEDALEDINKIWSKIHPDDISNLEKSIQESMENLSIWDDEWRICMNDGSLKWVNGRGTPSRLDDGSTVWNTLILDITERKQSEKQIRQLSERFSTLFHSTPALLALMTLEEGLFLEVNTAFENSFGFTRDELIDGEITTLSLCLNDRSWDQFTRQIKQEKTIKNTNFKLKTKSGEVRDYFGSFMLWQVDGEEFILSALIDMSDYKRLEDEAQKAKILEIELEKEKELVGLKDRFISIISHEFRTPLAVIQTSSDLLSRYLNKLSPERQEELFQQINQQIESLTEMINGVLSISRTQTGKTDFSPGLLNLTTFCHTIFEQIQLIDTDNHNFEFTSHLPDQPFMIDANLLSHILENLLSNAIKYSPLETTIQMILTKDASDIHIKVIDEGIGIPEEDQTRLFEPFHRASNVGVTRGTGLGLSIIKEYVSLHGGMITFTSDLDKGSTFTVTLPINY